MLAEKICVAKEGRQGMITDLTPAQLAHLRDTGRVLHVARCEPQPKFPMKHTYEDFVEARRPKDHAVSVVELAMEPAMISPLGGPGTEHAVGEEWCVYGPMAGSAVFYKADGHEPKYIDKNLGGWRSADTLPDWAVRSRVVVERVEVERAHEITQRLACETGMDWNDCPRVPGLTNGKPNALEYIDYVQGWLQSWPHSPTDFAWFTMLRMEEA